MAGRLWDYLSQTQQDLILEGQYLMIDVIKEDKRNFKDYSFLIFPFAKAFEGYLKKLFLDCKFISHLDYISDHLRLGKLLSPNLVGRLHERSLYKKIAERTNPEFAARIWHIWKIGRNEVFHYFPHNLKAVSYNEAVKIVVEILSCMKDAYEKLQPTVKVTVTK